MVCPLPNLTARETSGSKSRRISPPLLRPVSHGQTLVRDNERFEYSENCFLSSRASNVRGTLLTLAKNRKISTPGCHSQMHSRRRLPPPHRANRPSHSLFLRRCPVLHLVRPVTHNWRGGRNPAAPRLVTWGIYGERPGSGHQHLLPDPPILRCSWTRGLVLLRSRQDSS